MKLNHINLVVANVEKTTQFFETYFGFKCIDVKGDYIVTVLKGEDGFTLVIMKNREGSPVYPEAFHIGFMLDTQEQVNEIYQRLKAGGIVGEQEPRKIRDSFGFYFSFEDLMIEVGYYY
ncbi:glyoxalase/bleomycin resistance/extradiol dioxygenase family protein [Chryseobacterium sp. T16E-39]|uniref:VOC family protein n=1 Tax=Chryseobacterium sp. T16E-39 TaxID=2015076 RepID=UPI000B5B29A3|nr:VOC family protein [Chryseobacterium sp. T16E-39]ASK28894.1 glyoxalase/bleomycin resistance/extradiol dioxygenase family protein [Chryseobacterium sp. T16E-39]